MEERMVFAQEYTYAGIRDMVVKLVERYTPHIRYDVIGKSALGREIYALTLQRRKEPGEKTRKVLYAGAFHGMERLTAVLLLRFAERAAAALSSGEALAGLDARRVFDRRSLMIVPVVNPDGYEIALRGAAGAGNVAARIHRLCGGDFHIWNANARGVDINHNFNAGWDILHRLEQHAGIYGPAPTRYGGERPESEAETCALTELCRRENFLHVLAFHSQGEEIYWSYGQNTPERAREMAGIMAQSSGYALEVPMGLASHGGFKDWFIEEFHRPGFTIEIGKGKNPLSPLLLDSIYARLEEMLTLCVVM